MKNTFYISFFLLCLGVTIVSCGNKSKSETSTEATETIDKSGKEYTSAYICPMHCKGSGSDKPGECPVCKMKYVPNKDFKSDAHDHSGHDHDGHDHGDHEGHNH